MGNTHSKQTKKNELGSDLAEELTPTHALHIRGGRLSETWGREKHKRAREREREIALYIDSIVSRCSYDKFV